jgi:hypothetical protein
MAFMILATWLYLNAWCVLSTLSMAFSQYTRAQWKRRGMYSPNLGHVPREVGLYGYFLEFRWRPIRMPQLPLTCGFKLTIILDICVLCGLHGLT